MKALRLHQQVGDTRLHDEPIPVPGPGEALVRVTAVGVCGSDLHWLTEAGIGDARLEKPLVLGHEFAGVIASGQDSASANQGFTPGVRVAVDPSIPCGVCEFCLEGNPNLCGDQRFAGHGLDDGALREYIAWPTHCLFPLPDMLNDIDGVMLEPLGVAIHAVDLGHVKPGMTAGVFGCGPIGLLTIQMAHLAGATRIYATEKLPHRLEAARGMADKLGIDIRTFEADGGSESIEILKTTNGRGVDVAFEASEENGAVEAAFAAAKPGGRVVLIGIPTDNRTAFSASVARRKGLTIMMTRRMKHTYPHAIHLAENELVELRSLVTHRYPLEEFERAFSNAQEREGVKTIIEV